MFAMSFRKNYRLTDSVLNVPLRTRLADPAAHPIWVLQLFGYEPFIREMERMLAIQQSSDATRPQDRLLSKLKWFSVS